MSMKLYYGDGVLCLPRAVLDRLPDVNGDAFKVLLRIAADPQISKETLATELDITVKKVDKAIELWRTAGIIADKAAAPTPLPTKELPASQEPATRVEDSAAAVPTKLTSVPRHSTEELAALLASRSELSALIDECARVLGKIPSAHEISILLGIIDYLNVDGEYLLLLLAHCVKLGKKSVRYAETVALSLYDDGITDPNALQECLRQKEQLAEAEGKLRALFGMSGRALTTKEKKLINTWLFTYKYDLDIITRAYEMTVDAIGKPSLPYAGSILDRWAAADLHTLSDIEAADTARAANGKTPVTPGNSFDTDDFFGAALQRSFGQDFSPNKN